MILPPTLTLTDKESYKDFFYHKKSMKDSNSQKIRLYRNLIISKTVPLTFLNSTRSLRHIVDTRLGPMVTVRFFTFSTSLTL